jgi:hypothetical protein
MAVYRPTKQEIQSEILKCGKDPVYFLNTYARISDTQKGPIPFRTYDFQDQVLKDMNYQILFLRF